MTRYRYDPRGRLTATENAAGEVTAYHYNAAGDRVRTVFPGGRQEDVEYDARGQRLRTLHGGLSQRFSYDAAGRVLSLINENGARTQFVYDVMDRLIRETGFDGRIQQYQYSAAGELIHRLDGERATRWHYDAAGRVICRENPPHGDGTPMTNGGPMIPTACRRRWCTTAAGIRSRPSGSVTRPGALSPTVSRSPRRTGGCCGRTRRPAATARAAS
ncbi:hypothetical protein [Rahnella victoriana]|uniref:hypothetical protein n=1 Tax=Rahnella victoriana TaxID=1510570 RepID=UPI001E347C19|nr:hypothetical protein [Rahnella victoriana]UHM91750.1 hypothetical protein J9880_05175 [Rahnella victoriana]